MHRYIEAAAIAVAILPWAVLPARADNLMGYRLLSQQEAGSLPNNHDTLGLDVDRAEQITDSAMIFDIMHVRQIRSHSAVAQAGFNQGDSIIAVDGRVFPSLTTFAAYIASLPPGRSVMVDSIPAGGGPAQAQRTSVVIGGAGERLPAPQARTQGGMSTGAKVAIGVGAAALLGCYEMGCFSHRPSATQQGWQAGQGNGYQQR